VETLSPSNLFFPAVKSNQRKLLECFEKKGLRVSGYNGKQEKAPTK
jgi:hypothetical protein